MLLVVLVFACSARERGLGAGDDSRPGTGRDGGVRGADATSGSLSDGGAGSVCPDQPEDTPEACSDGVDNDCDRKSDCSDVSCSGIGTCPVCGEVDNPLGAPLPLPDGVGGQRCAVDGDCPDDQRCFDIAGGRNPRECRESYTSTLTFVGFEATDFTRVEDIQSVCVVMEHSWIRDLQIDLRAPNGQVIPLQRFRGQSGDEIYLGEANDCDEGSPVPGTGARYCWRPGASNPPLLEFANSGGRLNTVQSCDVGFGLRLPIPQIPPGDYSADGDWSSFVGSPLNGDWSLSVTDLWEEDNGYIFEWSISFDPNLVADCSTPLI